MEAQFNYIADLAEQYNNFSENPSELFKAINNLSKDVIQEIYDEYGDTGAKLQPLNLLRSEIARNLLEGVELTEKLVNEIKDKIRNKDLSYFKHLPESFVSDLKNYPIGKRDVFANWQKLWSIFHTFIYRGKVKETTQQYLDQLGNKLIQDLNLNDYVHHTVDFYGPNNFGSDSCWIALYPLSKSSHKNAYQFFVQLANKPIAGRMAGFSLKDRIEDSIKQVANYEETVEVLTNLKPEIIKLNRELRNYFKFAPGSQASEWDNFRENNVIAIGYNNLNLGDISNIDSLEQLNEKAGKEQDSQSNKTWGLWLLKTANIGDVVFANKGTNTCIGIGIISGEYYYEKDAEDYKHRRKVNWITDKVYQYKAGSLKNYKTLFRPDTFSPTLVWEFLLSEYLRLYPELQKIFEDNNLIITQRLTNTSTGRSRRYGEPTNGKSINFWWLNANPNIWKISSYKEGDIQTYTAVNEKGNKRRIYKHFESVQPDDLLIGYESSPSKQIKAIFEITKPLHINEEKKEVIEFVLIEKLEIPVYWNELQNDPGLKDCEVFKNNQGSLFKLTEEEFDIIRNIIDNKNINQFQEKK